MSETYHYPPELMGLLIDTIPLLCRSKEDTLLFLRGAGVESSILDSLWSELRRDRKSVGKYAIVRTVLTRLNEQGERCLAPRRELLRRVVEFSDYSSCWEQDRLKAQGLVCQVQKVVGQKDAFTRMKEERDRERRQHIESREAEARAIQAKAQQIEVIKGDLYKLFGDYQPQQRGLLLEDILNRLFKAHEISIREAFTVRGDDGAGIVEQIDGVVAIDGHLHFVEMKWWKAPVGVPEISQHLMRVFLRAETRAIIISASNYTDAAVSCCRDALSHRVVTLCTVQEIVEMLEQRKCLAEFLRKKVHATIMNKNPLPSVA